MSAIIDGWQDACSTQQNRPAVTRGHGSAATTSLEPRAVRELLAFQVVAFCSIIKLPRVQPEWCTRSTITTVSAIEQGLAATSHGLGPLLVTNAGGRLD
jgi:hypothetical protein